MSRGRTASSLSLSARRERAKELYRRGFTVTDVAREIEVSPDTASRYKKLYEEEIKQEATDNPGMLRDVLKNTFGALAEIDQVRQEAWRQYQAAKTPQTKATFLNTALKAGSERNKVLQLFGVKAEYMTHVAMIQRQQERLVEFLGEGDFCETDRAKIVAFLAAQITYDDIESIPVDESVTS